MSSKSHRGSSKPSAKKVTQTQNFMNMTMTQMVKDREVNPLVNQNKNKSNNNNSARVLKSSGNYQSSLQPSLFHQEDMSHNDPIDVPNNQSSNFNFISCPNYGDKIQRAEQIMNGLTGPPGDPIKEDKLTSANKSNATEPSTGVSAEPTKPNLSLAK